MSRLLFVIVIVMLLLQSVAVSGQGTESGHLYAVLVNGAGNRLTNHEPQYGSWPEQLGEQWTFTDANCVVLGINDVTVENQRLSVIWTVSGVRQQTTGAHSVYIERCAERSGKS